MALNDQANQPNYIRRELEAAKDDLALVHDLLAGTRRMWSKARVYIRKWADEDTALYEMRSRIESVFGGLERTLSAAVGMLFAKAPGFVWNQSEAAIAEHWQNIDAAGTAGPVFIKRFAEGAIRDGIALILVDHPSTPDDTTVTAANEAELGLRPTWAMYSRGQAISWRSAVINNQRVFSQVVLHEAGEMDSGEYGSEAVNRYRVLRLENGVATWRLYQEAKADNVVSFEVIGEGVFRNRAGQTRGTLPLRVAYAGRTDAPMVASIPLLGVAFANLSHWRQSTNLTFYREWAAFPQPTVIGDLKPQGDEPGRLKIGPGVGVHVEKDGEFRFTEMAGTSLEQIEKGVLEKLQQMAQQGLSFLITDTRAAETAEAKRLDATAENSTLATAAQGIEDAVNGALEDHAWYLGIEKAGAPVISISRDYESTAMEAQVMDAYAALVGQGFPKRVVLQALLAGGRIPADADLDELELEWEAAQVAERDAKALEQEAQAERLKEAA